MDMFMSTLVWLWSVASALDRQVWHTQGSSSVHNHEHGFLLESWELGLAVWAGRGVVREGVGCCVGET